MPTFALLFHSSRGSKDFWDSSKESLWGSRTRLLWCGIWARCDRHGQQGWGRRKSFCCQNLSCERLDLDVCPFWVYSQVPAICSCCCCHHQQWHPSKQNRGMPSCSRNFKRLFRDGIEAPCVLVDCSFIVRAEGNQEWFELEFFTEYCC